MSVVKIHLPFYTKKILLRAINLMNDECELIVQDIMDFKKNKISQNDLYKKIGNFVFSQPDDRKIFLLGDTGNLMLPIPWSAKILLKNNNDISESIINRYKKLGYVEMTEDEIIKELKNINKSTTKHTCAFSKVNDLSAKYDVYRLWFESHGKKPITFTTVNIMEYVFGTSDWEEIKKLKLWGPVTLTNINSHQDHARRLYNADVNTPILMTMYNKEPKLLDGTHRLIKSFIQNKKNIKVIILEKKELKKAEV